MEKVYFKDMPLDKVSTAVCAVMSMEERQTKTQSSYVVFQLSDGKTTIMANLWSTRLEDVKAAVGTLLTVRVYKKLYNGADSYEVQSYGPAPAGENIAGYVPSAPYRGEDLYNEILKTMRAQPPRTDGKKSLFEMVDRIYTVNHDALIHWAAAKSIHHNYVAGLVYHVFRMLRMGICALKVYEAPNPGVPPINAEVLLSAICLHDIGKLVELSTNEIGATDYTVDGNLFGHSLLGIEIVNAEVARAEAEGNPYDAEAVRMLKHCIASHHGRLDFGAITTPATREAFILNSCDDLDAKMFQHEEQLAILERGTMSGKVFGLGGFVYSPNA